MHEEPQDLADGLQAQAHALHDVQGHLPQALAGIEADVKAVHSRDVELELPVDAVQSIPEGCGGDKGPRGAGGWGKSQDRAEAGQRGTLNPVTALGYSRSPIFLLRKDWMYCGMMQKRRATAERRGLCQGEAPVVGMGPPRHFPPLLQRDRDPLTIGQTTKGPEKNDDVAEEEEEGDGTLTPVLGLIEEAQAAAVRRAQLVVAHSAHVRQPQPDIVQGSGCGPGASVEGQAAGNGDRDRLKAGWGGAGDGETLRDPRSPTWLTESMMERKNLRTWSPTTLAFWAMSLILDSMSAERGDP